MHISLVSGTKDKVANLNIMIIVGIATRRMQTSPAPIAPTIEATDMELSEVPVTSDRGCKM